MNGEDLIPHLKRFESYERACQQAGRRVPESLNIAVAICSRHRDAATRTALIEVKTAASNTYTFGAIDFLSDKWASVLSGRRIKEGDRVAVILPQSAALAIAHLGVLKLGAVVVPLSPLVSTARLEYAIRASQPKAIVTDIFSLSLLSEFLQDMLEMDSVFVADDDAIEGKGEIDFWEEVYRASSDIKRVETNAAAAAFIFYAPSSSGRLAGIVHSHRSLSGQFAAFEMHNNLGSDETKEDFFPEAVFWTPTDWASACMLLDMLYPALYYGQSVVAASVPPSTGEDALSLIERCEITNAFISMEELQVFKETAPRKGYELKLRSISSFGKSLVPEISDCAARVFGAPINFGYGTSETGIVTASCERWFTARPTSLGRAVPGHRVEILDASGQILPAGHRGRIAIDRQSASFFTSYLNDPKMTAAAFDGDWFITGDSGFKDEEGCLYI